LKKLKREIFKKSVDKIDKNDYLINFGNTVANAVENSLKESWKSSDLSDLNQFDAEIMHHSIYCDNVLKNSITRDKILLKVLLLKFINYLIFNF
jgi:hypothetical protein